MRITLSEEARMRGDDRQQAAMFSYISAEARVPEDHPLRTIRTLVDEVLATLSPRFAALYARVGRPSIPPEKLLRAQLLQVLYTIRSERQLMEQLDYNLLFRWFVGLTLDDPVWDPTVFTKNRQRLLDGEVALGFLDHVVDQARRPSRCPIQPKRGPGNFAVEQTAGSHSLAAGAHRVRRTAR
jgi:transposase